MNTNERNIQLADAIEVKQEGDVKQEPACIDELFEISSSGHRNEGYATVSNKCDAECDFERLRFDNVKIELKEEFDGKKLKKNGHSEEEAMVNQQDQQLTSSRNMTDPRSQSNNSNDTSKQSVGARSNPLKPHQCDFCMWSFARKESLGRHMIKHSGDKPHECDLCTKRFTR